MNDKPLSMRDLVDRLNETARAYYVFDDPLIPDKAWDELYDTLAQMERETGVRLPDSPTRRVGGEPLNAFRQHQHIARLWSMDKVQSEEALGKWFDRAEASARKITDQPLTFGLEHKLDGLTINLTYRGGVLTDAATRGNGEAGEYVLEQVRTIRDIPLSIPYKGLMEIHGEAMMRLSVFRHLNRTIDEPFKNARNAAAGALRNLNPQVTRDRRLSAFFYDIGTIENPAYTNQGGMLQFIRDNGFPVDPYYFESGSREEVKQAIRDMEGSRHNLDYMTDGAVIKITDLSVRAALGFTDKFPRWAVAFKFEAEEATTTLESVTWEVGRTGKLTPLAHVYPVDFSGVTVKRATLNNWEDINRKRLSLGISVWIRRSNDVIPEIMGRVEDGSEGGAIKKPTVCPGCGDDVVEIGAHLFCPNRLNCRPQVVARIAHFASRDAMDIAGLSEKTAETLHDRLNIREPAELYGITREQLLLLPGYKDKKADNLLDALAGSRDCSLDAFLFAVGIPNIGRVTARSIAEHFGTLDKVRAASTQDLQGIDEIGDVVAQSLWDFFRDPLTAGVIDHLLKAGVVPRDATAAAQGTALAGRSVVVTGTLPTLSRQQAEQLIREAGGNASSAVSRKTAYVVAGDNPGSKLSKAQSLGIPVITEARLLEIVKGS